MKIRILSDIHNDVNYKYPFRLADVDKFTIVAGDISGSVNDTIKWVNDNMRNGIIIGGNHSGYSESKKSLQEIDRELADYYKLSDNVSYLQNAYKIIDDIVFIGATLWTDFKLYGENFQIWDMQNAIKYMNDYKYNHYENDEMIRLLRPEDTLNMFNKSFEFIKNTVEKFKDKKIIVITHHAPSIKSIHSKYLNGYANACYASNLEQFILDNPNIKLWVHGHVHNNFDYMIGDTRVICNPRGYEMYQENFEFNSDLEVEV